MADPIALSSAIAGGVSAIASAVSAWKASRHIGLSVNESKKIATNAAKNAPPMPGMAKALQTIDPLILDALLTKIEAATRRLIDAIENPANSEQAVDKEQEIAKSVICAALKRIKEMNHGTLPDPDSQKTWTSFGCKD